MMCFYMSKIQARKTISKLWYNVQQDLPLFKQPLMNTDDINSEASVECLELGQHILKSSTSKYQQN